MNAKFSPSSQALHVMRTGKILGPEETLDDFFERVVSTIVQIESKWEYSPKESTPFSEAFSEYFSQKVFSLGTPTLTNAGRKDHAHSALSSCVVIPVDLSNKKQARDKIVSYYKQNMGSGFDLTPYENPVDLLEWINQLSIEETATGKYDRYIGNMGSIHVTHPKIKDFVQAKKDHHIPHFNISVDVTDEFMQAVANSEEFTLQDGSTIDAKELMQLMAECAWTNGDPGIVSLQRMNRDNPVADLIPYTSTPPCSEMGLSPGETCQFGYLNIASMLQKDATGTYIFDWKKLEHATKVLTRALDNAIEASMDGFPDPVSKEIAQFKRKIGIGICGVADTLIRMGMPYESTEAQQFVRNILSFINYASKLESVELAGRRGSCEAMAVTTGNKYYSNFLLERHGKGTDVVSSENWQQLNDTINTNKQLRNILTTALPPTGRASILLGVTSSIEPIFAASGWNEETTKVITDFLQEQFSPQETKQILKTAQEKNSFQGLGIKNQTVLKIAKEISPHNHLKMMEVIAGHNGVCDETVSKTVNLAHDATVEDVYEIFMRAYQAGLKNISVYRDKTHTNQPQKL